MEDFFFLQSHPRISGAFDGNSEALKVAINAATQQSPSKPQTPDPSESGSDEGRDDAGAGERIEAYNGEGAALELGQDEKDEPEHLNANKAVLPGQQKGRKGPARDDSPTPAGTAATTKPTMLFEPSE